MNPSPQPPPLANGLYEEILKEEYDGIKFEITQSLELQSIILYHHPLFIFQAIQHRVGQTPIKLVIKLIARSLLVEFEKEDIFQDCQNELIHEAKVLNVLRQKNVKHVVKFYGLINQKMTEDYVYNINQKDASFPHGDHVIGIVTEFVPGCTLDSFMNSVRKGSIVELDKVRILKILSETLIDMHYFGIVHGDLKPANILIHADSYDPILCDFGSSRIKQFIDSQRSKLVNGQEGHKGTLGYIAPGSFLLFLICFL